jgi:hypothetical protein
MKALLLAAVLAASAHWSGSAYMVNGYECGDVQARQVNGVTYWYAVSFGTVRHSDTAFDTEEQAERQVEADVAASHTTERLPD